MKIFKDVSLFNNIDPKNYDNVLKCLKGKFRKYQKEESLNITDKSFKAIVVLDGKIDVITRNIDGKIIIHNRYVNGDTLILWQIEEDNDLVAKKISEVLLLDTELIFSDSRKNCSLKKTIMENIIRIQNRQNYLMNCKAKIYAEKFLRNKIMLYLNDMRLENPEVINIPFSRFELASYLSCDRSALSRELSYIQDDGIIKINKNKIYILK